MEEAVGRLWDRLITRAACTHHAVAAVTIDEMRHRAGVIFRGLGGAPGLEIECAHATPNPAPRTWLQRLAGTERKVELAWRDERFLRLPERIDLFPERGLNRDLYLWLAALAAMTEPGAHDWFCANQYATRRVLRDWPGLAAKYRMLCQAHLAQRPEPEALPEERAEAERLIRQALTVPGSVAAPGPAVAAGFPVYLWLHPDPPRTIADSSVIDPQSPVPAGGARDNERSARRHAERVASPAGDEGLIVFRLESLFTWGEHVRVDRTTDDGDDEDARRVAEDLDIISVSRGPDTVASALRLDLDLPGAECDDLPLGPGVKLPEWDYRRRIMRRDHCAVQPMLARAAEPCALPQHLRRTARTLRRQFESLQPQRRWLPRQNDGAEIDLDSVLDLRAGRRSRHWAGEARLYRDCRRTVRDLSCLLLADLSLSTDAWISDDGRVIDVIHDSLFLFSEALSAVRDRFAILGFSSRNRSHVRINVIKTFAEAYGPAVRGRIQAAKPGFYTRMGAAIRYASELLEDRREHDRVLLLLTDGKPNDLDVYEGRYGIEDTRMAVMEARRVGIQPFCVTIDVRGRDYLPHLFGNNGFVVLRNPSELPRRLPLLYARLTGRTA